MNWRNKNRGARGNGLTPDQLRIVERRSVRRLIRPADPVFLVSYYLEHPGHWPHKWLFLTDLLTFRELAILDCRARGMTWKQITESEEVRLSTNTEFESLGICQERIRQIFKVAARRVRWAFLNHKKKAPLFDPAKAGEALFSRKGWRKP